MPSPRAHVRGRRSLDRYRLHQLATGWPIPTCSACGWSLPWRWERPVAVLTEMREVYRQHRDEVIAYARECYGADAMPFGESLLADDGTFAKHLARFGLRGRTI